MTSPATPTVRRIIGQSPPAWNRQAIFFANVKSLFFGNRGGRAALMQEIGGVGTYGGRLAPLVNLLYRGGDNLLVVENFPDRSILAYFREALGLSLPQIHVLSDDEYRNLSPSSSAFGLLHSHPAEFVEGFVTDDFLEQLTATLGKRGVTTSTGSRQGNNKLLLHQHLQSVGLPVFDTLLAADCDEVGAALNALRRRGYQTAVIKSQIGASGIGMMKAALDQKNDLAKAPNVPQFMFHEGACLVQGWLGEELPGVTQVRSPSVQLFAAEESLSLFDVTEQLLSPGSLHQGNVAPPPYLSQAPGLLEELLDQAEEAGRWLHSVGYRGTASVDFLLVDRDGQTQVRICEINARVTGATYPSMLARHFAPGEAWLMRNLSAHTPVGGAEILEALDKARLLYRPGQIRGVLPINFNLNDDGRVFKGQFLCIAPSTHACLDLLQEADALDTTSWSHARD